MEQVIQRSQGRVKRKKKKKDPRWFEFWAIVALIVISIGILGIAIRNIIGIIV